MKVVASFAVVFMLFVAPPASGLECFDCVGCSMTTFATQTQTCAGSETVAGVTMPLKCATIHIYEGEHTGVVRKCAPNVINGCMDVNLQGSKAQACYCTSDRCNSKTFSPISNTPALPGPSTASTTTRDPSIPLECYKCEYCSTVYSGTYTETCQGTEVVAGVEMPLKCAMIHLYSGPQTGVVRKCAPNVIEGCMDVQVQGYKANVCYCSTDRCNDQNDASKAKASVVISSLLAFLVGKLLML